MIKNKYILLLLDSLFNSLLILKVIKNIDGLQPIQKIKKLIIIYWKIQIKKNIPRKYIVFTSNPSISSISAYISSVINNK